MKKFIFAITILFSSTLQADPVLDLVENKMSEYSSRNDTVMVIFKAKGDVNSALTNIKAAMHTRDPGGFMNPYWIVSYFSEKVSMKTNCGVIIGQWYSGGFPYREAWEKIMDRSIQKNAQSGTYLYSQDGEFRITEEGQLQSGALKRTCFEGSKMAQNSFNTLASRVARDPAAEALAVGAAAIGAVMLLDGLFGGDSAVGDQNSNSDYRIEPWNEKHYDSRDGSFRTEREMKDYQAPGQ